MFEYAPGDAQIVCDGQYGLQLDFTKHSPVSNWEIELVTPLEQLDFSAFKGIRMESEQLPSILKERYWPVVAMTPQLDYGMLLKVNILEHCKDTLIVYGLLPLVPKGIC